MDYFRNNISSSSKKNPEFDKIKQYQKEIGKFNILSAEEEIDIIKQAQQGDQQARNRIIEANLGFVISVAKTYQNQGFRLRELISVGNIGLINAIKGFDDTKELKFISYAVRWIRQYILKVLDRDNHHIHIPQNKTTRYNRIKRCGEDFMQIHEREPTNDELAEILDMDIDYFTEIHQTLLSRYNFINTPIGEEDIIITDIETDKNLIELSEYEESEKLIDEILNENEAEIIKLFCGFNESQDSYSLETISEKMGGVLTRERTRQIKNEAIRKLRIYYKYDFSDGNYSQSIKRKKRLKNILKVKDILGKQSIKTIIKAINITRKGEIGEQSNIDDIYESMTICYTDRKKIQKAINTLFCNNKESIS